MSFYTQFRSALQPSISILLALIPIACRGDGVDLASASTVSETGSESSSSDEALTDALTGSTGTATEVTGIDGTGTGDPGPEDTGTGDTGDPASGTDTAATRCGNGLVEADEVCDDQGESSTCDLDCTEVTCGDQLVNTTAGEACEGDDLAGGSCEALGFDGGTLSCSECSYDTTECGYLPAAPVLQLGFSPIKWFDFGWAAVADAEHYQLLESPAPGEPFVQLGGDIVGQSFSLEMPLHLRHEASYALRACNALGCTESAPVDVMSSLAEAVGYSKASNTDGSDFFGYAAALSDDGSTLVVGAYHEDSNATGIGGNQVDDSVLTAGAAYVFVRNAVGQWTQQAYIKASNTNAQDRFGYSVALSSDGDTLAIGAYREDSGATGVGGSQVDNSASSSGAVYVFVRNAMGQWAQQEYIKASNTGSGDEFGARIALSDDGDTLAVGAPGEASNVTGIGGNQANDSMVNAGAVYMFTRNAMSLWTQQAYIKASNTSAQDRFGVWLALSGDGDTLAVGAPGEDSNATGIGGNQASDFAVDAGAAYVFIRNGVGQWSQQAYVKASNTTADDRFGSSLALSGDGDTLAVGAYTEDSNATGIGGNQANDTAMDAGAVYVIVRDAMGAWSQQAYVKASNTDAGDNFGARVELDGAGDTLAVAAVQEDGNAAGVGGNQADDSALGAGAVYVLVRDGMGAWTQRAYVKASNASAGDTFGSSVLLSSDASTLAVGASGEDGSATGIGGNQGDDSATDAGAVYLY